jgi:hypothetical protein
MTTSPQALLERAVVAFRAGQTDIALDLLARVLQTDPRNERAWLWMAGAAYNDEERTRILQHILKINPNNEHALKGLRILNARRPSAPGLSAPRTAPFEWRPVRLKRSKRTVGKRLQETIPEALAGDSVGMRGLSQKEVVAFSLRLGRRLLSTVVLLVALGFFVSVSMHLALGGGIHALAHAFPAATNSLYTLARDLIQGNSDLVTDMFSLLPVSWACCSFP